MKNEMVVEQQNTLVLNDMEGIIKRFLNYIDVSKATFETYSRALKQFCEYLYSNDINSPKREDILAYKKHLMNTVKPKTVNLYISAVKNLFKWLEYEEITKDITRNIKTVKLPKEHLKEALTLEQTKLVLDNAISDKERLMFLVTTTCGLRANEVVNIRLQDFKVKRDKILLYVLGKGNEYKKDFVLVDNDIYKLIQDYVKEYNITDYLFTSSSNRNLNGKLTTKTIRLTVKNMLRRVGIDDDKHSLHSCRHTFATLAIENGVDIRQVSESMRHSNIATTEIYLHDLEMIKNKSSNAVASVVLGG